MWYTINVKISAIRQYSNAVDNKLTFSHLYRLRFVGVDDNRHRWRIHPIAHCRRTVQFLQSLDWVLSHWANFTVLVFMCLYFVCFCFILYGCCIIVNAVRWDWWDWSLILRTLSSFSALTLLIGSLSRKNPSPIWPIMCLVGR